MYFRKIPSENVSGKGREARRRRWVKEGERRGEVLLDFHLFLHLTTLITIDNRYSFIIAVALTLFVSLCLFKNKAKREMTNIKRKESSIQDL